VAVHWSEVVRVLALKRDLGMVDQICLAFVCRDGASVELDEEMGGWSALTEALPSHLSGCVPWTEWFRKVAHPPFATNLTEIYVRSTGP
jgi:hypothetical protein